MLVVLQESTSLLKKTYLNKENDDPQSIKFPKMKVTTKKKQKVVVKQLNHFEGEKCVPHLENSKPNIIGYQTKDKSHKIVKKVDTIKSKRKPIFEKVSFNKKGDIREPILHQGIVNTLKQRARLSCVSQNTIKEGGKVETIRYSLGLSRKAQSITERKEISGSQTPEKSKEDQIERRTTVAELLQANIKIRGKSRTEGFLRKPIDTMTIYANDIIEALKKKDRELRPMRCLDNHKILPMVRAKMVDWMIEVMQTYKCSDQAFFLAVNIMDSFFQKNKNVQTLNDLHLVGITSMLIASKFEEAHPMQIAIAQEKIAHKKFSIEEIVNKEEEIFRVLGYNLVSATVYEFMENVLYQIKLDKIMKPELYEYLQKASIYFAKGNMYDYELLSEYNSCQLAACTLFVTFKVIEQLDTKFPLGNMINQVCEILEVEDKILYACASKILFLAKNFEAIYPNFKNLRLFHTIKVPKRNGSSGETSISEDTTVPSTKRDYSD